MEQDREERFGLMYRINVYANFNIERQNCLRVALRILKNSLYLLIWGP